MSAKPPSLQDGLLVIFEGIDGVGKSTQLAMANKVLAAAKWPVHTTRNLGGTPIGEALRDVMKSRIERSAETNLYISLAIQEALLKTIEKERLKGRIILMDRSPLSLAAYEIYGDGLDKSIGWQYVEAGMLELQPEVTIIYTIDVKTAINRNKHRSKPDDYFESKPMSYFERVAKGYIDAAKRYKSQTVIIDAGQSIKKVHDQTMEAIQQAIDKKIS